ncbi:MAG: alpha/beta hydrolase fold domain-containing protein [Bacteroidetes bacterium]|nr:alpha/beta hydrolase fold domain-containing protein [Bacteroidota bacterium]
MIILQGFGQTTVFVDDFNRSAISPGGTPEMNYTATNTSNTGSPIIDSGLGTGTVPYLKIIGYLSSGPTAGESYMTGPLTTFSSPYKTTLSSIQSVVTWSFNMRENHGTMSGLASNQRFFGVVLVASEANLLSPTCVGYMVSQGTSTTSGYQLVRFGAGLGTSGSTTTIISAPTLASSKDYMSVKVTFDPSSNSWTLYERTDGPSATPAWADPSTLTAANQVGSSTMDNTYVGTNMSVFGYFLNHSTSTLAFNAYVDNFKVTVAPETAPPAATFVPANGSTLVALNVIPTITLNEPVRKTDGTPLTDSDLVSLVVFKTTNASGTDVPFNAVINGSKTVITVTPVSNLDYSQPYYLAVAPIEDEAGNESGTQSATFTTMGSTLSNDATLNDLKVDGTTVAGFSAATQAYNMELPFGTTTVPAVTATPAFALATVLITPAASIPGTTSVQVTAQDGTTQLTYTVSFSLLAPSNDATLSNLRWMTSSGSQSVMVNSFSPGTLDYAVEIPTEVTAVNLVASPTQTGVPTVITPPVNLSGTVSQRTGTVMVTAPDGVSTKTYSILFNYSTGQTYHFKEGFATFPPENWTLTGNISNSTANGVGLYSAGLSCPKFKWTAPTDGGILNTPVCNTAGTLVFYIRVLDNNPASQLHFYVEKSTNGGSSWTTLSTDPMPMTGSTAIWHQVTIPVNDNSSSVIIRFRGTAITGTTATGLFYLDDVSLTMNSAADASLSNLKLGGTTIPGFSSGIYSYDVILPPGTTQVPALSATTSQPGASAIVTNAAALPGTSTVLVTAPNGINTLTYTVNLSDSLSAPLNLTATQVPGAHVTLNWSDNNSNETGFRIERKPTGGLFATVANAGVNATSRTNNVPGLNPNNFIPADRFSTVTVTSAVRFADVTNYQGVPTTLYLDVYEPTGDTTTARPMIIWIHGGGFRTDSYRTQGYIVDYCTRFAKRGYVCMSIDYRLRSGTDMPTQASEFPALQDAARDANAAISWVKANAALYHIDPNLIFIAGGSAGGRTAQTVCQFDGPDPTALYPPENQYLTTPWNKTSLIANATLWGGLEPEMRGWVYPYLQPTDIPTILVHGSADVTILPQYSIDLDNALTAAGITSELHIVPGATHSCLGHETEISAWVAAFFAQEWNKVNALAASYTYRVSTMNTSGSSGYSNTTGWPKADNPTAEGFTLTVDLNVPGTSWYVVLPGGDPAPTSAQVKEGKNASGTTLESNLKGSIACVAAKTEYSAAISGLSGSALYDVYVVAENAALKLQPAPTRVTITTSAPAVPANISVAATVNQAVCYNATNTITIAGTPNEFIVENGGEATMIAGLNILFLPGTKVMHGGHLSAYITTSHTYCGTKAPAMAMNSENAPVELPTHEQSLFRVYPNPSSGSFILEMNNIPENCRIRAEGYGMHGEKTFSEDLTGERKHNFSLSEHPAGIYFIRVIAGENVETIKIIKQ